MTDKTCSECRTVFDCGAGGSTGCWCNDFPPVMAPDPSLSCVCPSCLAKTLRQRIRETCDSLDRTACLASARPYRDRKPLIEHLDYHLEDGNWVFTEWFHWKRGQCCGNACRHCPYGHEAVSGS